MWDRIVSGVFESHADAGDAIKALQKAQVKSEDMMVLGQDSAEFRTVAAPLQKKGLDSYAKYMSIAGAFLGAATCLFVMWIMPDLGLLSLIWPLVGMLSGGVLGALFGMLASILIHVDQPEYLGRVLDSDISGERVLVAVHVNDSIQRSSVETILDEYKAIEVTCASNVAVLSSLRAFRPLAKVS